MAVEFRLSPTEILIAVAVGGVIAYFTINYLAKKQNVEIRSLSDVIRVITHAATTTTTTSEGDGVPGNVFSGADIKGVLGGSIITPSEFTGQPVTEMGLEQWNKVVASLKRLSGGEGGAGGKSSIPGAAGGAGGAGGLSSSMPSPSRPPFYDTPVAYPGAPGQLGQGQPPDAIHTPAAALSSRIRIRSHRYRYRCRMYGIGCGM